MEAPKKTQPTTSSQPSEACTTLFGLPPEIRLQIYDIVIGFDISQSVFDHCRIGTSRRYRREPICLPVANLAMSCRLISSDLRHHMHSLPVGERLAIVEAFANPLRQPGGFQLKRAPCQIRDLTALKVVINLRIRESRLASKLPIQPSNVVVASWLSGVAGCFKTELQKLFDLTTTFGQEARNLTEIRVHIHVEGEKKVLHSEDSYDQLVNNIRHHYETRLSADCLSEGNVRRNLRIVEFSSASWDDCPRDFDYP